MAGGSADYRFLGLLHRIAAGAVFAHAVKGTPLATSLLLSAERKETILPLGESNFDVFHSMWATFVTVFANAKI